MGGHEKRQRACGHPAGLRRLCQYGAGRRGRVRILSRRHQDHAHGPHLAERQQHCRACAWWTARRHQLAGRAVGTCGAAIHNTHTKSASHPGLVPLPASVLSLAAGVCKTHFFFVA